MKKIIYILVLALSVGSVYAQSEKAKKTDKTEKTTKDKQNKGKGDGSGGGKQTPEQKADKITAKLKEVLTLTEEQTPKVREITLSRITSIRAAKVSAKDNKQAFGQERKKIVQTWNTALNEILTPEQEAKFKAYKEEKKKAREQGKEKAPADDDGDEIAE